MIRPSRWLSWLAWSALVVTLALMLRADLAHVRWVEQLSAQGSPPPAKSAHSNTGYEAGLRHFLGTHERGDTYRWIALTQRLVVTGPSLPSHYESDNVPSGRTQSLPRLCAAWIAGIGWSLHALTGESLPLAIERAALWEPVIAHVLAFIALAWFIGRRQGVVSAAFAGAFFALFPPLSAQFLPGVLTARTWALLLGVYAIAGNLPLSSPDRRSLAFSVRSAVAAGCSLWLDPAFGFPSVLISAAVGIAALLRGTTTERPWLRWALIGAGITTLGWIIDRSPWDPAAGELRYAHPLYALAWLGLGLGIDGWSRWQRPPSRSKPHLLELVAGALLFVPLLFVQFTDSYKGWLYPSAAMTRLTSLDEAVVFRSAFDWLGRTSFVENVFVSAPTGLALALLAWAWLRSRGTNRETPRVLPALTILFIGVLVFAFFRVRWLTAASLLALPLIAFFAATIGPLVRRTVLTVFVVLSVGLLAWNKTRPASLRRPTEKTPPRVVDLQALIQRHFAHWVAAHHPPEKTRALAPPEFSDSLVFHGNVPVLMSTAWESYAGQIAAARILSAPEPTEAEAVIQSHELTHIVVPSWDPVLPLLVRNPQGEGKDTFYARLQRWLLPRYLRATPYHLPRLPGFLDQQLAVFQVVFPQDEALALARLAEYFAEMERPEPAGLVAQVLLQSFPDDPNASIARAIVYAQFKPEAGLEREVSRLAADVSAGRIPMDWDRRVQRAIVLALARKHDLARPEIEACLAEATEEALFELTPLQAYRLGALARGYHLSFPTSATAQLAAALGADYNQRGK